MIEKEVLKKAIEEAKRTMKEGVGGPFGAAIIDPDGKVYVSSNTVLGSHDPTAHAEVNVIRKACEDKKTHDLTGCVLYTTCYPCPMCLASAIWANIKEVWYGASAEDAAAIGFRDDYIYKYIEGHCTDKGVLALNEVDDPSGCKELFKIYEDEKREMY